MSIYPETEIKRLSEKAKEIRRMIIQMLAKAGSGHPGGSLSATDLVTCLYFGKLISGEPIFRYNPKDPNWPDRDRFHLSKGHCCPLWYAVLAECGYFPKEEIYNLRRLGSILQGHPDRRTPGVDVASGSLGQGLSVALGMSLAAKIDKRNYRVYVLLGDGEIQEGNIWEAAMACSHYRCDNLTAIVDYNHYQIDGRVDEIMNLEPLTEKWRAFGWYVLEIDGHNLSQILDAYNEVKKIKEKPQVIVAHTIKG
ncbi:MAG: transketolase, partial [Candidatus Omnitrophica bacterium]|nr:transketolase [Candidatus Omnitrophota bacterium]